MKMNLILYFAVIIQIDMACKAQAKAEKILFIGNSHTYYNDMPKIVEKMTGAKERKLQCDMIVQDGYMLSEHAAVPATINRIREGGYTKVILQENSLAMLFFDDSLLNDGLQQLAAAIGEANADGYILQNWANQYADSVPLARFGNGFYYNYFKNYDEAQRILINKAEGFARKYQLKVIPAGRVWNAVVKKYPRLDLWLDEWGHPNKTGSVIVAAVVYAVLFNEPVNTGEFLPDEKNLSHDINDMVEQIILGTGKRIR